MDSARPRSFVGENATAATRAATRNIFGKIHGRRYGDVDVDLTDARLRAGRRRKQDEGLS